MSEDTTIYNVTELQRQKVQDIAGQSVFEKPLPKNEEPIPDNLERKCQRLIILVAEIMAETNAIGMTADFLSNFPTVAGMRIRMQMTAYDFHRMFTDMEGITSINICGQTEKSICLGGVTFFTLVHESAAERAARMLAELSEDERRWVLESLAI